VFFVFVVAHSHFVPVFHTLRAVPFVLLERQSRRVPGIVQEALTTHASARHLFRVHFSFCTPRPFAVDCFSRFLRR